MLIDPGALMHVLGTKMDWVEDRLRWAGGLGLWARSWLWERERVLGGLVQRTGRVAACVLWVVMRLCERVWRGPQWSAQPFALNLPPTSFHHRSEFIFVNPNAKGTCGCGESFTVDAKAARQNAAAAGVQQAGGGSGGGQHG